MEWSRISEIARVTRRLWGQRTSYSASSAINLAGFWEWTSQTRLVGLVCLLSTLRLYSCPRHQTWSPRSRIHIYIYIHVCVLRMDTDRSRKGCKAWRRLTLSKRWLLLARYTYVSCIFSTGNALGCSDNGPRRTCLLGWIEYRELGKLVAEEWKVFGIGVRRERISDKLIIFSPYIYEIRKINNDFIIGKLLIKCNSSNYFVVVPYNLKVDNHYFNCFCEKENWLGIIFFFFS